MQASTVQLLAVAMSAVHGVVWVLVTRWERSGRTAQLRASLKPPPLLARAGYGALVIPLLYPVVVAIAPRWGYEGASNWSSRSDAALLGIGLGMWAAGMSVLVWAARTLGGYMDVDGVTENHELVTSGPYRYVRHPIYGSFTAIAFGLGFVFRSYLLTAGRRCGLQQLRGGRRRRRRCSLPLKGSTAPTAPTENGPAVSYPDFGESNDELPTGAIQ